MNKIELIGGPFDGTILHPSNPTSFVYTDGKRCYRVAGGSRVLYRSLARRAPDGRSGVPYWFEGYRMERCDGCGGFYVTSPKGCQLCGHASAQV